LKFEFLHDFHHGNANDEESYIKKTFISTIDGVDYGVISQLFCEYLNICIVQFMFKIKAMVK
jgi:hypothetical protein